LPNAAIRVCGKDFFVNKAVLPFISNEMEKHFICSNDPFLVSLTDADLSNSIFEGITPSSLIESASIFISLLENGNYCFGNQDAKSLHLPSLMLFAKKIFCNDFLSSIIQCSSPQSKSNASSLTLTFEPLNFVLNSFPKLKGEEFSFKVCSKVFKCSTVAAAILSKKAFYALKHEHHHSLEVDCPRGIERSTFETAFESVFKVLFGFPLFVSNENFDALLSISSQIDNSILFNSIVDFLQ
jgi:hypothetical protein